MKSPVNKFAAIAVVIVMANIGILRFRSNALANQASLPQLVYRILGLMQLKVECPRPMFVSTPVNIRVSNLRAPLRSMRPPMLVPAGTTNVALGKAVATSDKSPIIGNVEMITDGDKEAKEGSYVELGPYLQHVTIDLEEPHEIFAVAVWHYHRQPRVYFDVVVQTADDPDFTTNVKTIFNNDIDNSACLGVGTDMHYIETNMAELINAKNVEARYMRLYSNGNSANDLNHYIEVEIYGRPL